jgi:flagellar protein FliJ
MKRFEFSLQKLLNLREFREKEAELELGKAISAREAIQNELDDVAKKRVSASFGRRDTKAIEELVAIERYIQRLDLRKEALLEDLVAADLAVEKARAVYVDATKERRVITKLREKKVAAWHKEYLDAEAETLDDIANSRSRSRSEAQ